MVFDLSMISFDFITSIAFVEFPLNLKSLSSMVLLLVPYILIPMDVFPFNLKLFLLVTKSSHAESITPYATGLEDIKSIAPTPYILYSFL